MKNFGKIISDKDIITKEYLDSKGYISAITSKMVTDALGFTPFDSAAFTKTSIKNALGIADWALAANKPSYDDVYLKLTGGTITGNLTVNGKVSASGLSISTATASLTFTDNIIYSNASLKIYGGWSLRLGANGTGIQEWTDLKTILGLGSLAYKNSIEASDISSIAWDKITGKPTTLDGYGITDAVKAGFRFDSIQTGAVNILGWVEEANNWKGQGAGMVIGQKNYYTRINITGTNDDPTMYLSRIYAGTAYDWVKVLTEKNIGMHSIEIVSASTYPLPTDTRAFATYAYQRDGWVNAGPALAFPEGAYKGLVQMEYGPDNAYMRMFVGGVRPEVDGKILPWTEVLTAANIGSMAMSVGPIYWGNIDFNELTTPGSYVVAGTGNTNNPANNCTVLTITEKNRYFSSQVVVDINGQLYTRGKPEGDWREWKTYLDTASADAKYLKLAGGQLTGGVTFNGNVAFIGGIFFYNNLLIETGNGITLGGRTITNWDAVSEMSANVHVQTSSTPTFTLWPNQKHTIANFSEYTSVAFVLDDVTAGTSKVKFYYIEFTVGTNIPSISFNKTLKWQSGKGISNIVANKTYRIFIDDNLATLETY